MKISILQTDIAWGDPEENIKRVGELMSDDSDLFVLPEMWSTGFATEPVGIAEDEPDSVALNWMKEEAAARKCAISGSIAIRTNDGIYHNRHYFVNGRENTITYYDKHHLFSYGGEDRYYENGETQTVVNYRGWNFLLLTCYDLRFPLWSRYSDNVTYDAIIVVANWPENRQNAWQILTRARAIENQAFLIGVNRVGADKYCKYAGGSAVISPIGKTIAHCDKNTVQAVSCIIDLDELKHKREKFRVLEERDKFIFKS